MRIEIICTGDEVLTGQTVNTNFSYMSQKLEDVGLSADQIEELEELGERLGLPDAEMAEAVEDAARDLASHPTCPHCGGVLTGMRHV